MDIKDFFKKYYYQYLFKLIWALPIFAILISIDWITKGIASSTLKGHIGTTYFIKNLLNFKFIINHGSAYSKNDNNLILTVCLAAFGTILLMGAIVFVRNKFLIISVTTILAGSFANLIGRLWEPTHGVIDFMMWGFSFSGDLSILTDYIFNMADMYVNIGVILLIGFGMYYIIDLVRIKVIRKNNKDKYNRIMKFREDFIVVNHNYELKLYGLKKIKNKAEKKEAFEILKKEKIQDLERINKSVKAGNVKDNCTEE